MSLPRSAKAVIWSGLFVLLSALGQALEIPLRGGGGGGTSVGYVDMEAVFQEYPETRKAKDEYYRELSARRQVLADRDKELSDLREQMAVLRATAGDLSAPAVPPPAPPPTTKIFQDTAAVAAPETSTATVPGADLAVSSTSVMALKESLQQREKMLSEKESGLEQARLEAVKGLQDLEEQRSLQIFGKLYSALVQLAEEQGISLVVDKSSILYGQNAVDLTDKLRRRIRGLPEPSPDEMP